MDLVQMAQKHGDHEVPSVNDCVNAASMDGSVNVTSCWKVISSELLSFVLHTVLQLHSILKLHFTEKYAKAQTHSELSCFNQFNSRTALL